MEKYKHAEAIALAQSTDPVLFNNQFIQDTNLISAIVHGVPGMLYVINVQQNRQVFSNATIQQLFKMGNEEICDLGIRFFEKVVHPADQYTYFERLEQLTTATHDEFAEFSYRVFDDKGNLHWLTAKEKVLQCDTCGLPLLILGLAEDTTTEIALAAERTRLEKEQTKSKEAQQQLMFKAIISAQEEERRNIAENLHNEIGQLLFAAQLKLSAADGESRSLINSAIKKVRQISFDLTPILLNDMGLEVALKDMLERKLEHLGISFELSFDTGSKNLANHVEVMIYRIIQELLNNTVKYANASHVNVLVLRKEQELYVSQTDNGKGMDVSVLSNPDQGFGLKSIRNRLQLLNGVFDIFSTPEKGTKILMNFPLDGAE